MAKQGFSQRATISEEEQATVILTLDRIPPESLMELELTSDQIAWIQEIDSLHRHLKPCLVAYFSGQEQPDYPHLDRRQRDFLDALAFQHARLYDVLFWGWKTIQRAAAKTSYSLPATPGEALAYILEQECAGMVAQCFANESWTPTGERKLRELEKELNDRGCNKKEPARLNKGDIALITRYQQHWDKSREDYQQFVAFRDACLLACEKGRRNRQLTNALIGYRNAVADVNRSLKALVHPSRRTQGHTWDSGVLKGVT